MDLVLNGFLTGLLLSIFVGATFFVLIETSMTRGFKAALWFDAGVVLCDSSIIAMVYFFASWINAVIVSNAYFNLAGGLIFMVFGTGYIISRNRLNNNMTFKNRHLRLFFSGYLINLMNPSVVLFWLGTVALVLSKFGYNGKQTFIYYATALLTMASLDIVKAYFAYRISSFIKPGVLKIIYILSGIIMIGLGFYFIFK